MMKVPIIEVILLFSWSPSRQSCSILHYVSILTIEYSNQTNIAPRTHLLPANLLKVGRSCLNIPKTDDIPAIRS